MAGMGEARRASFAILIGCGLTAIVSPASADTVKFYNGGAGYTGPFNGFGTVYAATEVGTTACPTSNLGCGASDIRSVSQTFNLVDGLTITATVNTVVNRRGHDLMNQVWNDLQPNFGGLGVGLKDGPSDSDQIAGKDTLTLTFTDSASALHKVDLTGIATLFAPAHEGFGDNFDSANDVKNKANKISFLLSVDGGTFTPVSFAFANNDNLDITGHTFSFEQDPKGYSYYDDGRLKHKIGPEFYVSALDFLDDVCILPDGCIGRQGGNTPLPAAVWLFGSVIAGGAGVSRWRKSRKARAVQG